MKKILLLIFGLFTMLSYSQDNSDAELLLNKVSENIKNYENIYINYAYTLQNIEEDINQTNNGSFVTEDEKWRFEMLGVTRIFDGNKLYSIIPICSFISSFIQSLLKDCKRSFFFSVLYHLLDFVQAASKVNFKLC